MGTTAAAALKKMIRSVAQTDSLAVSDRELLDRFARENDQAAFAVLVRRHAGMVLGVCRRGLPTVQDAEDACQATFLILARKAKGTRWQSSVANWLYATARRVTQNARVAALRRERREARAAMPEVIQPVDRMTGRELLTALDEELERLPPCYREPLVLCYLEGLTQNQAAKRLGIPVATLNNRVARGRKRLHDALSKNGVCGAGLLALAATSPAGASPSRLCESILTAAAGRPPAAVAALVEGVAMNGIVKKSVLTLLAIVGLVALGIATGAATNTPARSEADEPKVAAPAKENLPDAKPASEVEGEHTYAGRVVDPDGKPVAGAKLYVLYYTPTVLPIPQRAASDKDGNFRFTVEKKLFDRSSSQRPWDEATVVAVADGYGLGIPTYQRGKPWSHTELTLRLAKDDVPVTGRVLDLQGKPVVGATVTVHTLAWPMKSNDLTEWLTQLKERKEAYPAMREHLMALEGMWMGRDVGRILPPTVTGADGRFLMKGIGRERVVALRIGGPTIVSAEYWAMTRPSEKIRAASWRRGELGEEMTFVGTNFEHLAAPCRPIVGVVRDKDTGKPIRGAIVESFYFARGNLAGQTHLRAVADEEGRYRLLGMPKGEGDRLRISPADGQPYLMTLAPVPDGPGLEPVTVDVQLKRGVWITGKVTDKTTGKPVHSIIEYVIFADNPFRREAPGLTFDDHMQTRAEDGTFRFVGLPGRAAVAARSWKPGYLTRVGADRIKGFDRLSFIFDFHTVAEVNPDKGAESVVCDLVLETARPLAGTIVDADGQPLTGVRISGLREQGDRQSEPQKTAEFSVLGMKSGEPRLLQFVHTEKNLAGSLVVRGDEKEPLTVKLCPAGVLIGRFVTTDGKPLGDQELFPIMMEPIADPRERPKPDVTAGSFPRGLRTDKDGKFRIEGLAPGLTYRLALYKGMYVLQPEGDAARGVMVKAGETKDLGELKIKLPE